MGSMAQVVSLVSYGGRDTPSILMGGGGGRECWPNNIENWMVERGQILVLETSICSIKREARSSARSGDEEGLGRRWEENEAGSSPK